jgi:hypothetical protein
LQILPADHDLVNGPVNGCAENRGRLREGCMGIGEKETKSRASHRYRKRMIRQLHFFSAFGFT